ncbi:MAG: hypothetical protein ACRDQ4_17065 [Pseudonocardiaceae bacterium]
MDATTPSTSDDEFDLDVRFEELGLEVARGDSDDCTKECTDDGCENTTDCD